MFRYVQIADDDENGVDEGENLDGKDNGETIGRRKRRSIMEGEDKGRRRMNGEEDGEERRRLLQFFVCFLRPFVFQDIRNFSRANVQTTGETSCRGETSKSETSFTADRCYRSLNMAS